MELGARIKQARLEAGLSQRQLCGDAVTRNMLSLIENGAARPSMDTLRHFSAVLGKPLSWFLEEETVTSPNQAVMAHARSCWEERDAAGVLRALEDYRPGDATFDGEMGLLRYLALLQQAHTAIVQDKLPYAENLLQQAGQCVSLYLTDDTPRQLLLARVGCPAQLNCDELLLAKASLSEQPEQALALLGAVENRSDPRFAQLMGLCLFGKQDYAAALPYLQQSEQKNLQQLEICCRELGDYKQAYEYACKQRKNSY